MISFNFTHDQLADAIERKYPSLKRGRDFLTAHPVRGAAQIGEAFIASWQRDDIEQPALKELGEENG